MACFGAECMPRSRAAAGLRARTGGRLMLASERQKTDLEPADRILFIIGGTAITGAAQIQKYGFLLSMQSEDVLRRMEAAHDGFKFYDDWSPHYMGPYSDGLKRDIEESIRGNLVVRTGSGSRARYALTQKGRARWATVRDACGEDAWKIAGKIGSMQEASPYDLLGLIYKKYPKYVGNGTITQ